MTTNHIVRVARALFESPHSLSLLNADKPPGTRASECGYLCILQDIESACGDEPSMRIALIGNAHVRARIDLIHNAQEKAERIQQTPGLNSSWLTRDVSAQKYGGGIRAGKYILSFSGLSELADEAFVLSIAAECDLAPITYLYNEIAMLSGSAPLFQEFITKEARAVLTSV